MTKSRRVGLWYALTAFVVGNLLLACGATPSTEVTGTTEGSESALASVPARGLPAGVPQGYLATPVGYLHASCLRHLRHDETLGSDRVIRAVDGSVRPSTPCAYPRYDSTGRLVQEGAQTGLPSPTHVPGPPTGNTSATDKAKIDGWSLAANATYSPAVRGLSVNWVVPPIPDKVAGQILFFFPGTEPLDNLPNATILQPVLGFENGGGAWAVQSWNCCVDGTAMYADKYAVNPGDVIQGTMTGTNCDSSSGICQNWVITTTDVNTGQSSVMNTTAFGHAQRWIFGAVLEAYGLTSCDELPSTRRLDWHNFGITALDGSHPTLSWKDDIDATLAGCGIWGDSQTSNGSDFSLYFGASTTAGGAGQGGIDPSATYQIVNPNSGKCLDISGAGTADGTKAQLWTCNGTGAQSFKFQSTAGGAYQIVNTNSGKCVDISGAGTANGTQVQLWTCNGTGAQSYRVPNGTSTTTFVNTNSGSCVDVYGAGNADGTKVELWSCNGTGAQGWQLQSR